jgi:hypothetical protein
VFTDIDATLYYISVLKTIDATYFYCNWFTQYSYNLYKASVVANQINEITIVTTYATKTKKKGADLQ